MKRKIIQYAIFYALGFWGIFSIIFLAGEEIPGQPMSLTRFFILKTAGMASLILCFITGRWLNKKGLLPEIKEED